VANLRARMHDFLSGWRNDLSESWRGVLDGVEPNLNGIDQTLTLEDNETIFPGRKGHAAPGARPDSHVFRALDGLPLADVRAVILGQDPYPKSSRATGRSFEQGDLTQWSPKNAVTESLRRILQVVAHFRSGKAKYLKGASAWAGLVKDIESGALALATPQQFFDQWQDKGVLCLNVGLTFSRFKPVVQKAHVALWSPVVQRILTAVATRRTGSVVFLLWGRVAAQHTFERLRVLDAAKTAGTSHQVAVATAAHPAAVGAGQPPFFRPPNVFSDANEKLQAASGVAIKW
jgi:uracil-DNA glycosylase